MECIGNLFITNIDNYEQTPREHVHCCVTK